LPTKTIVGNPRYAHYYYSSADAVTTVCCNAAQGVSSPSPETGLAHKVSLAQKLTLLHKKPPKRKERESALLEGTFGLEHGGGQRTW
jgi:hypothetical protein